MWSPLEKWERGFLFPSRSWKDWTTSGWQNFFVTFFSPLAKWCSFLGKSDSLLSFRGNVWVFFSLTHMKMLSFSKMMLSFRKVHWVFFLSLELRSSFEKKNSMDFPSGQHHFASGQHLHITFVKKNLKHFLFRTKESLTFLRDYIILPPEKKIDKKILHPSVSQSSHDLLGNKSPLSHFSSVHHISSRTPFHFPRTLSFKITVCRALLENAPWDVDAFCH